MGLIATTQAQVNTACPGLHNPTNFNSMPGGLGSWSARVGDRVQGSGGSTGNNVLSTCSRPNKTVIRGANILSPTYNSGSDANRCACTNHCNFFDGHDQRFRIYTQADAGMDQFTVPTNNPNGNGLPRIPPGHNTSIRLGDMRATGQCQSSINGNGNDKGAEALFYTMKVNSQNTLLFIDYAIVACRYNHTPQQAGEFLIRVCGKNSTTGQWNNFPLNDSLWFNVPAPAVGATLPAPWMEGYDAGNYAGATYCGYCYKPWTRVAISLIDHLYDSVRVEMYTSDCIYDVDPIYAYIAGSCQPMSITTSGCPGGNSDAVDTLRAPEGLLSYTWYVASNGFDGNTAATDMSTVPFRQVATGTDDNARTYIARLSDFITDNGDTACATTFKCVVTSAMDPEKPFHSVMYASVSNTKPIIDATFDYDCDGNVTLTGLGRVCRTSANSVELVDTLTRWVICEGSQGDTPAIDSVFGRIENYQFSDNEVHAVNLTFFTTDNNCYTTKTFQVHPTVPADTRISIDKRTLCVGEEATITDLTTGISARQWVFADRTINSQDAGNSLNNTVSVTRSFTEFENPFMLITTATNGCKDTLYDTIYFFHDPEIHYSNDTIICNGHETHVVATTSVRNCQFAWFRHKDLPGESPVSDGNVLMVRPTQNHTKYYLRITAEAGCVAWDSVTIHILTSKITAEPKSGKFCPGDHVTLTGSGAAWYEWYSVPEDPNLAEQAHQETIEVAPEVDTRYYLIGYAADSCDIAAISYLVQPIAEPTLDFEFSPRFIDTEIPVVNFYDKSEGRDHTQWLFSDGGITTGQNVTHHFDIYLDSGNCVTLKSFNEIGCYVDTTFCIAIDTFGLYIPNMFLPSKADNNKFAVVSPSEMDQFHIAIYNRRGLIVYESDDIKFEWDGTRNGTAMPTGAYVYVITYTRAGSQSQHRLRGTVMLVR